MIVGINASLVKGLSVGLEVYTLNLVRLLSKNTRLLVYTSKPQLFENIPCRIKRIPAWTQSHLGRFVWEQLFLPFSIVKDKIDLLFSPLPELPILSRVPSIAVIHDLIPLAMRTNHTSRYKAFFWLTLQSIRRADLIIAVSENTKQDLLKLKMHPQSRICVTYEGSKFSSSDYPERMEMVTNYKPYILYVGGFAPAKNVPCLIKAFSMLARGADYNLVLVGWGKDWHLKAIEKIVNQSDARERIFSLENVPEPALHLLYDNAEVFVCPSFYEGFGLPLLEAMSCGTPTICSHASSLPEIGGNAVVYFDPNSHEELYRKMKEVLENPKLRRQLSRASSKRAKFFSWKETASKTEACIRRLFNSFHN